MLEASRNPQPPSSSATLHTLTLVAIACVTTSVQADQDPAAETYAASPGRQHRADDELTDALYAQEVIAGTESRGGGR